MKDHNPEHQNACQAQACGNNAPYVILKDCRKAPVALQNAAKAGCAFAICSAFETLAAGFPITAFDYITGQDT
jgi:hypothetical protein